MPAVNELTHVGALSSSNIVLVQPAETRQVWDDEGADSVDGAVCGWEEHTNVIAERPGRLHKTKTIVVTPAIHAADLPVPLAELVVRDLWRAAAWLLVSLTADEIIAMRELLTEDFCTRVRELSEEIYVMRTAV